MRKPRALPIPPSGPRPRARLALALAAAMLLASSLATAPAQAQGGRGALVVVRDAETEAMLSAFLDPLLRAAGLDPRLVPVTILQDRSINAFVATGNRLFLHTGLIQQSGSAAELAGVLAHEVGHVWGGHLARLPEEMRAAMIRSVAALLLGAGAGLAARSSDLGVGVALGAQSSAMGALYAFSRAQEQAADEAALTLLDRVGWPAHGKERMLRRLLDQELLVSARQDPYFRTHPLSRDRLDHVRDRLTRTRVPDGPLPAALEARFAMVQAKLEGFLDAPAATWRRTQGREDAPGRYARAIAQHRSGRPDAALDLLAPLLRERPNDPYLHEFAGQVLFEAGRPREAAAPLATALRLAPQEPLIRAAYGRALLDSGEPARASPLLAEAARAERDNGFTWRLLADARARLDDLPGAELALAEAALAEGDTAEARFRAARAERGLQGPPRLRAADIRQATRPENLTPAQRRAEADTRRERPR